LPLETTIGKAGLLKGERVPLGGKKSGGARRGSEDYGKACVCKEGRICSGERGCDGAEAIEREKKVRSFLPRGRQKKKKVTIKRILDVTEETEKVANRLRLRTISSLGKAKN